MEKCRINFSDLVQVLIDGHIFSPRQNLHAAGCDRQFLSAKMAFSLWRVWWDKELRRACWPLNVGMEMKREWHDLNEWANVCVQQLMYARSARRLA